MDTPHPGPTSDPHRPARDIIADAFRPGLRRFSSHYSRLVGILKLALPSLALILVALVVLWPQINSLEGEFRSEVAKMLPTGAENLQMINPRYSGLDREQRPYNVSAETAHQARRDSETVELVRPKADVALADGTWVAITAESGAYDQKKQVLDLLGSVNLFHDSGYEFATTQAQIDFASSTAEGEAPISGQGPFGVLKAQGFKILERGDRIHFTGAATMTIFAAPPKGQK